MSKSAPNAPYGRFYIHHCFPRLKILPIGAKMRDFWSKFTPPHLMADPKPMYARKPFVSPPVLKDQSLLLPPTPSTLYAFLTYFRLPNFVAGREGEWLNRDCPRECRRGQLRTRC